MTGFIHHTGGFISNGRVSLPLQEKIFFEVFRQGPPSDEPKIFNSLRDELSRAVGYYINDGASYIVRFEPALTSRRVHFGPPDDREYHLRVFITPVLPEK